MQKLHEGTISIANLLGHISKTESEHIFLFEVSYAPDASFKGYKNYLEQRLKCFGWRSSNGTHLEPVSDIQPRHNGLSVLVRACERPDANVPKA